MPHGTGCDTHDKYVTLYWGQCTKKCTILLDLSLNVGILYSSSGYQTSNTKCEALKASLVEHGIHCCNNMGFNPDNDGDEEEGPEFEPEASKSPKKVPPSLKVLNQIHFDLQGPDKKDLYLPLTSMRRTTSMSRSPCACSGTIIDYLTSLFPGCNLWHKQVLYQVPTPPAVSPFVHPASMARLCTGRGEQRA